MIYKIIKKEKYTQILNKNIVNNELNDEAFRLHCYLMSKTNGWEVYNNDIIKQLKWTKHKLKKALKNLKENYLIQRYKIHKKGRLHWITNVYEESEMYIEKIDKKINIKKSKKPLVNEENKQNITNKKSTSKKPKKPLMEAENKENTIGRISTDCNSMDCKTHDIIILNNNNTNTNNNINKKIKEFLDFVNLPYLTNQSELIQLINSIVEREKTDKTVWARFMSFLKDEKEKDLMLIENLCKQQGIRNKYYHFNNKELKTKTKVKTNTSTKSNNNDTRQVMCFGIDYKDEPIESWLNKLKISQEINTIIKLDDKLKQYMYNHFSHEELDKIKELL